MRLLTAWMTYREQSRFDVVPFHLEPTESAPLDLDDLLVKLPRSHFTGNKGGWSRTCTVEAIREDYGITVPSWRVKP